MTDTFDNKALRAIVHHIVRQQAIQPEKLGLVKLHKILWFCEVRAIRSLGVPLIGERFIRHQYGPFATHLDSALDDLSRAGVLHRTPPTEEFETESLIGKGTPDRGVISDQGWRLVDSVMAWIVDDHSASTISERSHDEIWEAVELHDEIPPMLAAIRIVPTPDALKKAIQDDYSAT